MRHTGLQNKVMTDPNDQGDERRGEGESTYPDAPWLYPRWYRNVQFAGFLLLIGAFMWSESGLVVGLVFVIGMAILCWAERAHRERMLPELMMFADPVERDRVLTNATKAATRGWRPWVPFLLFLGGGYAISQSDNVITAIIPRGWNVSACQCVLLVLLIAGCSFLQSNFVKGRILRSLRTALRERGHEICVPCGYDLTGNVSGICPECGEAIPGERRETACDRSAPDGR
jgi:hypothetical protein